MLGGNKRKRLGLVETQIFTFY